MARNNTWGWVVAEEIASGDTGYTPRELKAQAMVLTVLGYSSREVERKLRSMFPGERTPPWTTIARWQRSRPINRTAALRWMDIASRAAKMLEAHLDRIEQDPLGIGLNKALKIWERANAVVDRSRYYQALYK